MFEETVEFIRRQFGSDKFIPLHEPRFAGKEKEYLNDCIDSTFVSSVGPYVDRFEKMMAEYTGARYAVAATNGTLALHMALIVAGTKRGDLVISQPLSFIATSNAIAYIGAEHLFLDVDKDTMGLSPSKMEEYLEANAEVKDDGCYLKSTGQRIAACVPMHTFGYPCYIAGLADVCHRWGIMLVEDAAESLGSLVGDKHTGTFGQLGIYSFNGNKTVTCGGGGCIVTNDEALAKKAKHLTTQAKVPHRWEFVHDEIGYNYRLPNLNAALACAQLEQLEGFIADKRGLAASYAQFFADKPVTFFTEPGGTRSNYWLCALLLGDREERDAFLTFTNDKGVMTRPAWTLMQKLPLFRDALCGNLDNALWLEDRIVNIPSSARLNA